MKRPRTNTARPNAAPRKTAARSRYRFGDGWVAQVAEGRVGFAGGEWHGRLETRADDPTRISTIEVQGRRYALPVTADSRIEDIGPLFLDEREQLSLADLEPLGHLLLGLAALCREKGLLPPADGAA